MPLQAIEPLMMLAPVASEVVYPAAAALGGTVVAMAKAIEVLYKNGRGDTINAVSALKDAASALDKLADSNKELAASHKELTRTLRDHVRRTGTGG